MSITCKHSVFPSPAVFTLGNSCSYGGNVFSNVEWPIDKAFGISSALSIPNINPHYGHVRLGKCLDNTGFGCESYILEDMCNLDDTFNVIRFDGHAICFVKERYTQYYEVWFWLRETRRCCLLVWCLFPWCTSQLYRGHSVQRRCSW